MISYFFELGCQDLPSIDRFRLRFRCPEKAMIQQSGKRTYSWLRGRHKVKYSPISFLHSFSRRIYDIPPTAPTWSRFPLSERRCWCWEEWGGSPDTQELFPWEGLCFWSWISWRESFDRCTTTFPYCSSSSGLASVFEWFPSPNPDCSDPANHC